MNSTNNIDINEVSRLSIAKSVVRVIENNHQHQVQRYHNQQWEPLTKSDLGVLILNPRAKTWLNEHCETIVEQYEEDKAERQNKRKEESIRRASEWQHIADLKFGKLEIRVLELKDRRGRKVQLNNKDKWQDCTAQEIQAIRTVSPFNELLIRHFDGVAGKSTTFRPIQ